MSVERMNQPPEGDEREDLPPWKDHVHPEPELPEGYLEQAQPFDEEPPPQLVRTVNLLPAPEHDLRRPDDIDGIAEQILSRTKQGVADIFDHEDYAGYEGEPTEAWARAIAEHQTGAPYTMPAYFYGAQKKVAAAIAKEGRYPLVGQCQQSVTTALCLGGWDGGTYGDIGSGIGSQPYCASLGQGFTRVPHDLKRWSDELWSDVKVGSCLFWSAESQGEGHVVVVIRKHPTDRKWQIWDTGTSFTDPSPHAAAAKGARMLWESQWWNYIPTTISRTWAFRGIGLMKGLGHPRSELKPRGRTRLLLRRRRDHKLVFRSEWIDMEAAGLPISWLLRGLRGAPFSDSIEATFCVNSPPGLTKSFPDGAPLLDCLNDAKGNAKMTWSWQWKQGYHDRKDPASWKPSASYRDAAPQPAPAASAVSPKAPAGHSAEVHEAPSEAESDPYAPENMPVLWSDPLRDAADLQEIARGRGSLKRGDRGPAVMALQRALVELGIDVPGGADGIFGRGTAEALKKVQSEAGIEATGVADEGTLLVIDKRLQAKSPELRREESV